MAASSVSSDAVTGRSSGSVHTLKEARVLIGGCRGKGGDAEVFAHVSGVAHAGEGDGDTGGGTGELDGALGVGSRAWQVIANGLGKVPREPRLAQRGAGDGGDVRGFGDIEHIPEDAVE